MPGLEEQYMQHLTVFRKTLMNFHIIMWRPGVVLVTDTPLIVKHVKQNLKEYAEVHVCMLNKWTSMEKKSVIQ